MSKDANFLACNGGGIVLTKDWARNVLRRMGMVKRRANTKTKVTVEIIGKDNKRQLTAVFGCSMSGDFLPPQLIYQGKTKKCLPHF